MKVLRSWGCCLRNSMLSFQKIGRRVPDRYSRNLCRRKSRTWMNGSITLWIVVFTRLVSQLHKKLTKKISMLSSHRWTDWRNTWSSQATHHSSSGSISPKQISDFSPLWSGLMLLMLRSSSVIWRWFGMTIRGCMIGWGRYIGTRERSQMVVRFRRRHISTLWAFLAWRINNSWCWSLPQIKKGYVLASKAPNGIIPAGPLHAILPLWELKAWSQKGRWIS